MGLGLQLKQLFITFTVCSLLIITGCSTPTVHLYGRYLTDEQVASVTQRLNEQWINVEVNQHQFPASIGRSAIIYSPFISEPQLINQLEQELTLLDWAIEQTSALKEWNHWFQKNSVGLFLVPDGVKPHSGTSVADMANLYQSEGCPLRLSLTLSSNGRYSFSEEVKSTNYSYGYHGDWRMRAYPYIEMRPDKGGRWLYFEAQQATSTDQVSALKLVHLVPMENYANLAGCQFTYGQRI